MPGHPAIEVATLADLPAISALRLAQGWGANVETVRAVMGWAGGRVFVIRASQLATGVDATAPEQSIPHAEADPPVVTTCACAAGAIGVIGSVIVREDYQRRGLGRMIMDYALAWQRAQGVRAVYLDASLAGRPLYHALGFVRLEAYSWLSLAPLAAYDRAALSTHANGLRATVADVGALTRIGALDARAYGGDRLGLLVSLLAHPDARLLSVDDANGQPAGYLTICLTSRDGSVNYKGVRIGPWVATSERAAAALLLGAVEQAERWRMRITDEPYVVVALPETNLQALDLLRAVGCQPQRDDLLMRLDLTGGTDEHNEHGARLGAPGDPALVYAWLASMTF